MHLIGCLAQAQIAKAAGIVLATDGRLFDKARLAATLDCPVETDDAELILAAYRRWGRDCPAHLNGDFRFVVEDPVHAIVLAAVDHMAARPLFYTERDGDVLFASSVRELADAGGCEIAIDEERVARLLVDFTSWSADRSLYKNIHKVPFAHTIEWREGEKTSERYYHPERIRPLKLQDEAAYVSRGKEVFASAVRDRALTPKTLGVHVSGGLDSSAVVSLATIARREAKLPEPRGYAWQQWQADAPPTAEGGWIAAMAEHLGIEIAAKEPSPEHVRSMLKLDLVADYNIGNLINESLVQQDAAERGIGLILSGWGGDELLSFNGRYMASHLLRRGRMSALANLHPPGGLGGLLSGVKSAIGELKDLLPSNKVQRKVAKSFAHPDLLQQFDFKPSRPPPGLSPRQFQLYRLNNGYLSERMEVLAQSGQRNGLSYSFPMLDRRVIEFALSVPVELFRKEATPRWLFREMTKGVLPEVVRLNQSKQEPERTGAVMAAIQSALREVGSEIAQRDHFDRGFLLDMNRLRAELETPDAVKAIAPLRLALQLLDL